MTRRFQYASVPLVPGLRLRLDLDSFSSIDPNDERFNNTSSRMSYQHYEGYTHNKKSCELIVSVNKTRF